MPEVGEHRYFRGDKGIHFLSTITMVDFTGLFIFAESGFSGRMVDRSILKTSELSRNLDENNVDALADRGFTNEPHCITPQGAMQHKQMAERALQECVYHELRSTCAITREKWRHQRSLQPFAMLLSTELFNFKKRRRLTQGLKQLQEVVNKLYK